MLKPITPYNFDATIHKPSHFPSSDNLWEKGKYYKTLIKILTNIDSNDKV